MYQAQVSRDLSKIVALACRKTFRHGWSKTRNIINFLRHQNIRNLHFQTETANKVFQNLITKVLTAVKNAA